jgi:o-succinylbenzoate---CoA ligase
MSCLIRAASESRGAHIALEFGSKILSFNEVESQVAQLELELKQLGVVARDRVVIHEPNSPNHIFLWFALMRIGAVMIPLNPKLSIREMETVLAIANPGWKYSETLSRISTDSTSSPLESILGLFTSGTTGVPKLVELSRNNFSSTASASQKNLGDSFADVWLGTLPLFHIGGLAMVFRWATAQGKLVLRNGFDVAEASDQFDSQITQASLVPTTLQRLLDHRNDRSFSNVKSVLIGGAPMSKELLSRARKANLPVFQTWGMTECCSQITTERSVSADGSTAGNAIEGVQVKVCDESGKVLPSNTVGELHVKGPTLAIGLPEWFATKDLGSIDELGRVTIASRRVDLIISGGENIYPAEIEAAFMKHPSVSDVAVVGSSHSKWGEVPVAFVVLKNEVETFIPFLQEYLARFKIPKKIIVRDSIARNAMGKVDRLLLKAEVTNLNWLEEIDP